MRHSCFLPTMVLFSFHYALTSFWIGVWAGWPAGVPVVVALHYGLQLVLWAAGLNTAPTDVFWGWQALISFCGALLAMLFLWLSGRTAVGAHALLEVTPGHEVVWVKGALATAAYVAIQLLYAHYPPPSSAYGLVFTVVATLVLFAVLWNSLLFEGKTLGEDRFPLLFFAAWAALTVVVEGGFYLAYTALAEHWVALVALGIGAAAAILADLLHRRFFGGEKRVRTLPLP